MTRVSQVDAGTSTSHQKLPALLACFVFFGLLPGIMGSLPVIGFQVVDVCSHISISLLSWLITSMNLPMTRLNSDFLHTNLIMK